MSLYHKIRLVFPYPVPNVSTVLIYSKSLIATKNANYFQIRNMHLLIFVLPVKDHIWHTNHLLLKQKKIPVLPKNHKHPMNLMPDNTAVVQSKALKKLAVRVDVED